MLWVPHNPNALLYYALGLLADLGQSEIAEVAQP